MCCCVLKEHALNNLGSNGEINICDVYFEICAWA